MSAASFRERPLNAFAMQTRRAAVLFAAALVACRAKPTTQERLKSFAFPFPADTLRAETVVDGVGHYFIYSRQGPWAIHVLDVRLDQCNQVVAVKGVQSAVGRIKTTEMLRRLGAQRDVRGGVNADFFSLANGVPANLLVMDGRLIAPPSRYPAFAIDSAGRPHIEKFLTNRDSFAIDDRALRLESLTPFHPREAVGGRPRLLRDSAILADVDTTGQAGFATGRHPRTAVGIAGGGRRLLLVTVDGRQKPYSDGMTLRELATLMLALGAPDALNLDGGGSTTMVTADPVSRALRIANQPSDSAGERSVGDALAIVKACR